MALLFIIFLSQHWIHDKCRRDIYGREERASTSMPGIRHDYGADLRPDDRVRLLGRSPSGNDYLLSLRYPKDCVKTLEDLMAIPIRGADHAQACGSIP
jgi:hypothetical protein